VFSVGEGVSGRDMSALGQKVTFYSDKPWQHVSSRCNWIQPAFFLISSRGQPSHFTVPQIQLSRWLCWRSEPYKCSYYYYSYY